MALDYPGLNALLIDFLRVAIHNILYIRSVYPSDLFEEQVRFGVKTRVSRHPDLNAYIDTVITGIQPNLESGRLKKVYLVILDTSGTPIERFTLDVRVLVSDFDKESLTEATRRAGLDNGTIERSLRDFLLKVNVAESMLTPNPPDSTFTILIDVDDETPENCQGHNQSAWIPFNKEEARVPNGHLIPLKSMTAGVFQIQLHVEESSERKG